MSINTKPMILTSMVLFLAACAAERTVAPQPSTSVFIDEENQLHYEGALDAESNELLFNLYENAAVKPNILVISSVGGGVSLGIDIGEWVHNNDLIVNVGNICASSCANYIFTAANQKGLRKDSVIFWHGSTWQKNLDELYRQGDEFIVALREREVVYFEKIDVDHRLTTYGLGRYSFWSRLGAFLSNDPIAGFDYSIEDMAKFGVTNVQVIDGHWSWREYTDCCNVKRVKVNDDFL